MKVTKADLKQTKENIFFIIGPSRSGSTLLQSMLATHSHITIPPETHFFKHLKTYKSIWEKTVCRNQFRKLLFAFWEHEQTRIGDLHLPMRQILSLSYQLGLYMPIDIYNLCLTFYRKTRDKSIIGEKTPRHMLEVDQIRKSYPNAKFVALFRDPRAVAYSEKHVKFGSPSVFVSSKRWRKYVKQHHFLQSNLADNKYMLLRYCDLVGQPEIQLKRVCDFLNVKFENSMLQYYEREEAGFAHSEMSWKKETLEPIKKDKNQSWKNGLKETETALIETVVGGYLQSLEYNSVYMHKQYLKSFRAFWPDYMKSVKASMVGSRKEKYTSFKKLWWLCFLTNAGFKRLKK